METLYTSDLHLGHLNLILTSRSQFKSVEEMDEYLIQKWNEKVQNEDDLVYILGDVSYRSPHHISYYLKRMRGRKILVVGNHDRDWMKNVSDMSVYFERVENMIIEKKENGQWCTLCHFPILEWSYSRYCQADKFQGYDHPSTSLLIHGHTHGNRENSTYLYIKEHLPAALNASVDVNDFAPVTLEELIENNKKFYERG